MRKRDAESLLSALTALDILLDLERGCARFVSARLPAKARRRSFAQALKLAAAGPLLESSHSGQGQELNALFPRYVQLVDVASP